MDVMTCIIERDFYFSIKYNFTVYSLRDNSQSCVNQTLVMKFIYCLKSLRSETKQHVMTILVPWLFISVTKGESLIALFDNRLLDLWPVRFDFGSTSVRWHAERSEKIWYRGEGGRAKWTVRSKMFKYVVLSKVNQMHFKRLK